MKAFFNRNFGRYSKIQHAIRNQLRPFRGCKPTMDGWVRCWSWQYGFSYRWKEPIQPKKRALKTRYVSSGLQYRTINGIECVGVTIREEKY